ncbi:MAG TPA: NYN domain-containing protein, partial [Bauldia sp.]|nr:NYN domain-containing protein [Bauldia sp.]
MADTVKCALFVDYDSIYRRLAGANPEAAGRLAQKVGAWVGGIETGSLVAPASEGVRRRILIRRCYASPEKLGAGRAAFVASGFEVVDCPIQDGRDRNSADIHIVLDTIDALEHPAGYEEFILLSADADLTPVLLRLRAHARTTLIYTNEATAATYRAIADGMIEEAALAALVTRDETAPPPAAATATPAEAPAASAPAASAPAAAAPAAPPVVGDRNQIEALARKVHAATNVPLFSPRTYADLFRHIAQEIAERGYHFQHTA